MITIRRSDDRFHSQIGWLDSRHTFSFAEHYDPRHLGFRSLRVINEDYIAPSGGFPTHPHRDMEILTYVIAGSLEHRDSMGNGSIIRPGEIQRMTAGRGVRHSEANSSPTETVHLLQIWIIPETIGLDPSYEQRALPDRRGRLACIASRSGGDGAVTIHQDVALYAADLDAGSEVRHRLSAGRHAWVQVVRGAVRIDGTELAVGDGAAISGVEEIVLATAHPSELLLFDLA